MCALRPLSKAKRSAVHTANPTATQCRGGSGPGDMESPAVISWHCPQGGHTVCRGATSSRERRMHVFVDAATPNW